MDTYLTRARDEIERATAGLTVAQIGREQGGRWSIAEILEHLTLAFRLNESVLEKALADGQTRSARPTARQWLARVLVIDVGYFPPARAPEAVVPRGSIAAEQSRDAIAAALVALDATLERAGARFGLATPLLKHAFFAGMTVPQWRKFHWRHAVHHMRQVRARSGPAA